MNNRATVWTQWLLSLSLCLLGGLPLSQAQAQPYPNKTVRIIEPAGPGSAVDTAARELVPKLAEVFGQSFVIENRAGGNSGIGAREAARAQADGYTLFHGNINNALNDLLTRDACCRLGTALVPVTRVVTSPLVMVVHPSVPAKTLQEFISLAKSQPQALTYASGGVGSITQLLGELVKSTAGLQLREIPYKAIGAELPDLLAGHVMAAYLAPVAVAQHIKSGKLRALGVAHDKRIGMMAEVPTFAQAGLPGVEASGWNGIFVPAGTPVSIINRLQVEIAKIFDNPAYKQMVTDRGSELGGQTPEEFGAFVRSEITKWGKVIADAKIQLE